MKKKVILFVGSVFAFALTFSVNLTGADHQSVSLNTNEAQASIIPIIPTSYGSIYMCPNQQQYMLLCLGAGSGCTPVNCDDGGEEIN